MADKISEETFLEAVASTLRAMAGGKDHEVIFIGDNSNLSFDKIKLPKINDIKTDSSRLRGEADKIALWLRYHNEKLDQNNYCRLKFGIGNDFPIGHQSDYVLDEWSDTEIELLDNLIIKSSNTVLSFCTAGLDETMKNFN